MRLGCEVTASDLNPVAWFILKCTLEYPHKLAGQTRPLPLFALEDREFMETFLKARGFKGVRLRTMLERLGHGDSEQLDGLPYDDPTLEADLAWHVRAWGRLVLSRARKKLAPHYPVYADFQPLKPGKDYKPEPMRLLEAGENGIPQLDPLNAGFDKNYLKDPRNPRWVAKPTVAYLWARTVKCKQCRATMPLLKTRWLCKKSDKRVLLTMKPDADRTDVVFGIETDAPRNGGNAAQRREHDRRIGAGTMSRRGAYCPCCSTPDAPTIMTMGDIRAEGLAGRLGTVMTAIVADGPQGKEYRLPTSLELSAANTSEDKLQDLYADIPFGFPDEPICAERPSPNSRGASGLPRYGLHTWKDIFTNRQLFTLGTFIRETHNCSADDMQGLPKEWREAIVSYFALLPGRLADRGSALATWTNNRETTRSTFARFALPIVWDFAESCPLTDTTGSFVQAVEWVGRVIDHLQVAEKNAPDPTVLQQSATKPISGDFDVICTDPPYYDAIPYSDLMDFFHVWMRRALRGIIPTSDSVFDEPLGPKWDQKSNDGELVDQPNRFSGNKAASKQNYEDGMACAFQICHAALNPDGRLVVVFANKQPEAWETLSAALIRAGFVVDGSWPIQTEMQNKLAGGARLASSVWLVCRKRLPERPGWDTAVLTEMRENISRKLRDFWDAGIRGPDFVWSATGPALEAYSKYPAVKKADDPGQVMEVSEFLREVRRIVVDFVVGRVLTSEQGGSDTATTENLDDVTTYYLLHRHDFGMGEAPIGACILYALSCNLSDSSLSGQYDLLARSDKGSTTAEDGEEAGMGDTGEETGSGSGTKVKLKAWNQRRGRNLGLETSGGRSPSMIDQVHKLMHLWCAGDQVKVNDYLETRGLERNALFGQLLQALIELSSPGSEERSLLESLSNHVTAHGRVATPRQGQLV